jgi:hypothetical protein
MHGSQLILLRPTGDTLDFYKFQDMYVKSTVKLYYYYIQIMAWNEEFLRSVYILLQIIETDMQHVIVCQPLL